MQLNEESKTICFVSNELFPLHKGGIGRLMYNFAKHNDNICSNTSVHILVPSNFPTEMDEVLEAFEDIATIHRCQTLDQRPEELSRLSVLTDCSKWSFSGHYLQSLEYFYGLLDVERIVNNSLTIIEFPDFGGWALATIAAKRSRIAFQNTIISARLHSSLGLLTATEKYYHHPSLWFGCVFDAERQLLQHADMIIGHVPAIIKRNAVHYGFDEDWVSRAVIEFPLITLDTNENLPSNLNQPEEPDFIFSSRLQPFKRPDLFIKSAIMFLENRPNYSGYFRIVSYGWDKDYIQSLEDLIPNALAKKILFFTKLCPSERNALINNSIVVIPSDYESLCLFAFESSQNKCKLILNKRCEAFGAFDRWVDESNCLMFDGTSHDLVKIMEKAITWQPTGLADISASKPYWVDPVLPVNNSSPANEFPLTILVAHGFSTPSDVTKLLLSLQSIDGIQDVRVIFFLPRAMFPPDSPTIKVLQEKGVEIFLLSGYGKSAEELWSILSNFFCEVIVLIDCHIRLHPQYLLLVRRALAQQQSVAIISTHTRTLDPQSGECVGVNYYAGDLPSVALLDDIVSPPVLAIRSAVLKTTPFEDSAGEAWLSIWLRNAICRGVSAVIIPVIGADVVNGTIIQTNSCRLTGSVIDNVCMEWGLPSRLLALVPAGLPSHCPSFSTIDFSGERLRSAIQIWPTDMTLRNFPLVQIFPDNGGLLVHPLDETVVIACLPGPNGAIRIIEVDVTNASDLNNGIEFSFGCYVGNYPDSQASEALSKGRLINCAIKSDWFMIEPGAEVTLSMRSDKKRSTHNYIILMTRVPRGRSESYCHLVFRKVRCYFVASL